jgi:hypothetical protein
VRQTVLTALGGIAVLAGFAVSLRTYSLTRRGQVTDRFTAAVALLASSSLEQRLGGVLALEHIMLESPADQPSVVGLLNAFIHAHPARGREKVGPDVQAAVRAARSAWKRAP